jgi:fatty-acid desaturase
MMQPVVRVDGAGADATAGRVVMDWPKAAWNGGMLLASLAFAVPLFSWSAFAVFIGMLWLSQLIGHSVGMHRMMIHRTFACGPWPERALVYIGVLVGVAGPFGIIRIHDVRDWAQRQPHCHAFFAHSRPLPVDLFWQLACRFVFERPPSLGIEPHYGQSRFYRFLDASWRWHQLPLACLLYLLGGWSWVIWGVCVRVFTSAAGHWTITHFCHRPGPGRWQVAGACVQAANLPGLGLITYGECWHNNHHAFPESARIGLEPGQSDPGWWVIAALMRCGLVWHVGTPRVAGERDDLIEVSQQPGLLRRPAAPAA